MANVNTQAGTLSLAHCIGRYDEQADPILNLKPVPGQVVATEDLQKNGHFNLRTKDASRIPGALGSCRTHHPCGRICEKRGRI
jgi:hypothetical protein